MKLPGDFKEFIGLLNAHGVRYVVVGGYAVAYHGYPRFTGDLDVFVEPSEDNSRRMEGVVRTFGFADSGLSAEDLKRGLSEIYSFRLRGVYVYGSYARGDFDEESDLDVLVVLDDFSTYGAEVDRSSKLGSALSLRYSVSISLVFVREREWREETWPFLANVQEEAVAA